MINSILIVSRLPLFRSPSSRLTTLFSALDVEPILVASPPLYSDVRSTQPPSYNRPSSPPAFPSHLPASTIPTPEGHWTCTRTITENWTFTPGPSPLPSTDSKLAPPPSSIATPLVRTESTGIRPLRLSQHVRSLSYIVDGERRERQQEGDEDSD